MKALFKQIDNLKIRLTLGNYSQNPKISFKDGKKQVIEAIVGCLIANHLISIQSMIEQSSYHLHLAHKEISQNIANVLFKRKEAELDDINLTEWNQEKSLNAAIVFTNALFDFIKILMVLIYSDSKTLIKLAPKDSVAKDMKKNSVNDVDWYLSLYSIIGDRKVFDSWYNKIKKRLNSNVTEGYSSAKSKHQIFRKKYQANALKHFGTTTFKRTDPANIVRNDFHNISMSTFYTYPKNLTIGIGGRGDMHEFEQTRIRIIEELKYKMEFVQLLINQIV